MAPVTSPAASRCCWPITTPPLNKARLLASSCLSITGATLLLCMCRLLWCTSVAHRCRRHWFVMMPTPMLHVMKHAPVGRYSHEGFTMCGISWFECSDVKCMMHAAWPLCQLPPPLGIIIKGQGISKFSCRSSISLPEKPACAGAAQMSSQCQCQEGLVQTRLHDSFLCCLAARVIPMYAHSLVVAREHANRP